MDVDLPDGTVITDVPEGTTQSQLRSQIEKSGRFAADQLNAMFGQAEEPGFNLEFDEEPGQGGSRRDENLTNQPIDLGATIGRKAAEGGINSLLGTPDAIATITPRMLAPFIPREEGPDFKDPSLIRSPLDLIADLTKLISGGAIDPAGEATVFRQNMPALGQRIIPGIPSGQQVVAGVDAADRSVANLLSGQDANLPANFDASIALSNQMSADNPKSAKAGALLGEIAAIFGLGIKPRSVLRRFEDDQSKKVFGGDINPAEAAERARQNLPAISTRNPGLRRELDDIFNKKIVKSGKRGLGRAAEGGVEGFMMAILDEGDPAKTAALSAAAQATGSSILGLKSALLGKGITPAAGKTAASFAALAVAIDLFKEKLPGVDSDLFQSGKMSIATLASIMGAGFLSNVAGFGRAGTRLRENIGPLIDGLGSLSRGAIESFIKDFSKAKGGNLKGISKISATEGLEEVIKALNQDPNVFGKNVGKVMERAFRNGKVIQVFTKLMKGKTFRDQVNELRGENE